MSQSYRERTTGRLTGIVCAVGLISCGSSGKDDDLVEDDGNFAPDHVLQVSLTLDEEDWESLRRESRTLAAELSGDCRDAPFSGDYTWFSANVTIDGESLENIGVRKKGFIGSQNIQKPSLKLNLDEYVDGAELFGVDNIVLNNGVQDGALIRQCLSYALFDKAGLPAPRCNYARVSVNEEDLGIYVHVEPVKRSFLRAHFENDDGDLYEGTVSDFHRLWYATFEPKTDETDTALGPIIALMDDLQDGSIPLESVLEAHIELDSFLTYLAMETWTGHWDGYGGNQNNFFIYRDTETDRFTFIPWGMDGAFDLRVLEDSFVPQGAYIAKAIHESPELSDRFYDRLGELLDVVYNEGEILAEIDRMEALLATEIDPSEPSGPRLKTTLAHDIEEVREYVRQRRDNVRAALPVTPGDFDNPYCMREVGSIEASFETSWNTEWSDLDDVLSTGDLDMLVTYEDDEFALSNSGAVIGPPRDEGGEVMEAFEDDYAQLMMLGEFDAGGMPAYLLPYLSFPVESILEGERIGVGWHAEGGLLYAGSDTDYEFVEAGGLWEGTLGFDEFDLTPGGVIRGSMYSGIYIWEEVTE